MVNNITSANERWTEYDYEICVANDWDIEFCAEHLRISCEVSSQDRTRGDGLVVSCFVQHHHDADVIER